MSLAMVLLTLSSFGDAGGSPDAIKAVGTISLENLVRVSELIVIGEVLDVRRVPYRPPRGDRGFPGAQSLELPVANVLIEQRLKGPPVSRVLFAAMGTWVCDSTTAVPGERVLLFLSRAKLEEERSGALSDALAVEFGDGLLWSVEWSGRGRMPLQPIRERACAVYESEVLMPRGLERVQGLSMTSTPLDELAKRIGAFVGAQSGTWLTFRFVGGSAGPMGAFLSISGDGQYGLDGCDGVFLHERTFKLDPKTILYLGMAFQTQDVDEPFLPAVLDSSACGCCRGTLTVHSGDRSFEIPIRPDETRPAAEDALWRYQSLLEAWETIHAITEDAEVDVPR